MEWINKYDNQDARSRFSKMPSNENDVDVFVNIDFDVTVANDVDVDENVRGCLQRRCWCSIMPHNEGQWASLASSSCYSVTLILGC